MHIPAIAMRHPEGRTVRRRHPIPYAESAWAKALRWIGDRRRLAEMDDRLLRDLGLTREDVARGVPFTPGEDRT